MENLTGFYRKVALHAISRRAAKMREESEERVANRIRNELVEAWNKGQS